MDINDILQNDTVKNILDKVGVSEEQAKSIAAQAMSSIQSKFAQNPKQMSSLLSENDNTEDDIKLEKEVEDDFVSNLIEKVGLPDNIADQIKGAIPGVMSQFTGKLSADGKNDEGGIAGMLGGLTDMFGGDDKDGKDDGISGMLNKFF